MTDSLTQSKAPTAGRPQSNPRKDLGERRKVAGRNSGALEMAWVARMLGSSWHCLPSLWVTEWPAAQAVAIAFYDQLDDEVLMAPAESDSWGERERARSRAHIAFLLEHPLGASLRISFRLFRPLPASKLAVEIDCGRGCSQYCRRSEAW